MRIGIDARLYSQTGVGRYIRNLVAFLGILDKENEYVVFLIKEDFDGFKVPNERWSKVLADYRWHGIIEQVMMVVKLTGYDLNLVHFPYFNVPLFYFGKYIITVHDLIHLHVDTGRASTLPRFLYRFKKMAMRIVLKNGLRKAEKVICVSEATKEDVLRNFDISGDKIKVIYEGVDEKIVKGGGENKVKKFGRYILYVGNAYPHKNLKRLVKVFFKVRKEDKDVKLLLVGPDDFFYRRLKEEVKDEGVVFYGPAKDGELSELYGGAEFLVLPSLMEGFGLVGLEAMSLGCLVLASDISVLREVYGDGAVYFNPKETDDIYRKMNEALKRKNEMIIKKGGEVAGKYSWEKMARETFEVYRLIR